MTSHNPSNMLNTDEAAAYLGIQPGTLAVWRTTKRYPLPYVRVGRRILYRRTDLDAFIEKNVEQPVAPSA